MTGLSTIWEQVFHFSELKQLVGDEWEQQAREAEQTWLDPYNYLPVLVYPVNNRGRGGNQA